jgi:hypothetical protein
LGFGCGWRYWASCEASSRRKSALRSGASASGSSSSPPDARGEVQYYDAGIELPLIQLAAGRSRREVQYYDAGIELPLVARLAMVYLVEHPEALELP